MLNIRDWKLGLYCASILIGAGMLTLALPAGRLGVLPVIGLIVGIGAYMTWLNGRFAASLYGYLRRMARRMAAARAVSQRAIGIRKSSDDALDEAEIIKFEVGQRGSWLLAEYASGIGTAGRASVLLGMLFYVLPADIGYMLIGSRSLRSIAGFIDQVAPQSFIAFAGVGLLVMFTAWYFERLFAHPFLLRGTLKKFLMMVGSWSLGIAVMGLASQVGIIALDGHGSFVATVISLGVFTGAVLAGLYTRVGQSATLSNGDLNDQHTVNVMVVVFEIVLLTITAVVTIVTAARHNLWAPTLWIVPGAFSWSARTAWADLVGVVLFAYVGTGLLNLCSYPTLFETVPGQHWPRLTPVVIIGTVIPMALYLVWTLVSVSMLSPQILVSLDAEKAYTTIGIFRIFEHVDVVAALLISLFGYMVALLAVTSACNGFTESLADQLSVALKQAGHSGWPTDSRDNLAMRLMILLTAVVLAFGVNSVAGLDISSILAVAGSAGGGLLLLILPFYLPTLSRRKSSWSAVMMGMTTAILLTILLVIMGDVASINDTASAITAGIVILIALSVLGMAFWLLRSEPEPDL